MKCSIDNCNRKIHAKGLCSPHYNRLLRSGDVAGIRAFRGKPKEEIEKAYDWNSEDCLIWPYANCQGYPIVRLDGKNQRVTRIVCERINGPPKEDKSYVLHSCGGGSLGCYNPKHLRWGDQKENMEDCIEHGKTTRGSRQPNSKITEETAIEVKRRLKNKQMMKQIAADLDIPYSIVISIHIGRSWSWLSFPEQSYSEKCNDN